MSLLNTQSPLQTLTLHQLPLGYRFCPDDQELVRFFLYPKLTNPLFTTSAPVRDCDLYAHQPLQIWNTFHRLQGEDLFFFTNLRKKTPDSNNATRKIAGGPATWHREDTNHKIHVPIDRNCSVIAIRKCFSYQNTQSDQPAGCSWTMYEYSLPSLSQVIVLCQLRRKDDDNRPQTQTTKKRKRDADAVDDAANTISQKARVDENDQQHQIMGASETVSALVYNGVKFDNFESFSHEVVKDFDEDQMGVNSIASTSYIAAPTVSTSNCAKNLQPTEVVCIDDTDGEDSATEEDDGFHKETLGHLDFSGSQKARVDENDQQHQIMGASETVSALVYNGVKFDNFESFSHEVVKDFDEDQMGVNSIASTSYIAAPTVSTSNCAKNLQPIEVVCIDDTDGEDSAKEEDDGFHKETLGHLDFSGSQKARVDENDQQQQIMGASETVSALVYNGVKFDNFESFSHEVVKDFDEDQMGVNSIASTSYIAAPTVSTSSCAKNLQPIEVVCIDDTDGEDSAKEEDDGFHKETLGHLDFSGCSDKGVGVPTMHTTAEADLEVQATPIGSTLVESRTTDAVAYHLDSEVSDSSLSSDWREPFSQNLLQANPTCQIQENEVQMIFNTFYMECLYEFHQK